MFVQVTVLVQWSNTSQHPVPINEVPTVSRMLLDARTLGCAVHGFLEPRRTDKKVGAMLIMARAQFIYFLKSLRAAGPSTPTLKPGGAVVRTDKASQLMYIGI